jgi:hypothetical protein
MPIIMMLMSNFFAQTELMHRLQRKVQNLIFKEYQLKQNSYCRYKVSQVTNHKYNFDSKLTPNTLGSLIAL